MLLFSTILSYRCSEKLEKASADRKCEMCRTVFKTSADDRSNVAQAEPSICPR